MVDIEENAICGHQYDIGCVGIKAGGGAESSGNGDDFNLPVVHLDGVNNLWGRHQ